MFGMWFVITMALGGVANHVLNPSAGRNMGYLAIAVQFGFAFAFPVRDTGVGGAMGGKGGVIIGPCGAAGSREHRKLAHGDPRERCPRPANHHA